ncbi:putative oxidoreductase C-terminal domain-containing protein [Sediminibacterium soli]|uniref:putative oxidoreductase C-terminal domain-containing protein n=1 Tax=Sediminibacterium soli TaxID=2698829 RepID=UPI00137949BB|nr:putative oxidoreductase C-terminal domain-containing protein [Sediminibacterium soli]NCI46839.1 Gfo/Idh/MocA family oxidoreductase [Sediminibacterium soli]
MKGIKTAGLAAAAACITTIGMAQKNIRLITLDPGHFHAALVQKSMYPQVDNTVHVYAPKGNDVTMHLDKIKGYNSSPNNPTQWKEVVYEGSDYLQKMLAEKKGNLVVLAGNNRLKTDYIAASVKAGLNVFADKPMAIDDRGFEKLKQAFVTAKKNKVQLYDIMTERYEITTLLQRAFSMESSVFGALKKGTLQEPAVTKESVHHFYKYVSGSVLTRPAWFLDVAQQGEGIVDVTTHLVDLIQWECFPGVTLDYRKDIAIQQARHWATKVSKAQFTELTKETVLPAYLAEKTDADGHIGILSNGEINYTVKGVHAKVSVIWNYKAPEGTGDTHYSIMRGTRANLVIRQGAEQQYKPTLYIEPMAETPAYEAAVEQAVKKISAQYKGLTLKKQAKGWEVIIPDAFKEGHEAHFARVMEKYLEYLSKNNMPSWEVPNMIAKYYTTTRAFRIANKK